MEEKQTAGNHKIWISERKTGTISGVKDVVSFDEHEILVNTDMGILSIRGKGLHINRLNLEKKEADLEGQVDSLIYSDNRRLRRKEKGLLGRLLE